VDLKTESVILDALERLMRTRTVFLVTHRPSTWTMCDLWLQVERGRLTRKDAPLVPATADTVAYGSGTGVRE
jgi:ABC-type multidrug transport system fused ATPase/permease subunit